MFTNVSDLFLILGIAVLWFAAGFVLSVAVLLIIGKACARVVARENREQFERYVDDLIRNDTPTSSELIDSMTLQEKVETINLWISRGFLTIDYLNLSESIFRLQYVCNSIVRRIGVQYLTSVSKKYEELATTMSPSEFESSVAVKYLSKVYDKHAMYYHSYNFVITHFNGFKVIFGGSINV